MPFNLGNVDAISGIAWLSILGEVRSNWQLQTLCYNRQGEEIKLRGDPGLRRMEASVKGMFKALKSGGGDFGYNLPQ